MTAEQCLHHTWLTGDTATTMDLLPTVREGFDARKKFKHAFVAIRLANRMKTLSMEEDDEEDNDEEKTSPQEEVAKHVKQSSASGLRFAEVVRAATAKTTSDDGSKD